MGFIDSRLRAIDSYLLQHGYQSYDPYDGLTSPIAGLIRNWFAQRLWQQVVRFTPINIRPLLGVKKIVHTKAVSDFASAYALRSQIDDNGSYINLTHSFLTLLENMRVPTKIGIGWGLRFRFATRFVAADDRTPNSYQTINAIHAFLDGYEATGNSHYL